MLKKLSAEILIAATLAATPALAEQENSGSPVRQPWMMKGLNADVQAALNAWPHVRSQFPGMNAIRLNCNPDQDSTSDIARVVQLYTGAGMVVEVEDHSGNTRNLGWYRQMSTMFTDNPLVYLETPNEPGGDVENDQIAVIQAIRDAGFQNWIGIQPRGGYDQSNVGTVIGAVGTQGLFVTPHIYDSSNDPNSAAQYVASELESCRSVGLQCVIDEFGNAMDGWHLDPQGTSTIMAVIAQNEGKNAGAVFWALGNGYHEDGADSACLNTECSSLTSTGHDLIQPWLWGAGDNTPPPAAIPTNDIASQLTALTKQTDTAERMNKSLQDVISSKTATLSAPASSDQQQDCPPDGSADGTPQPATITPADAGVSQEQADLIKRLRTQTDQINATLKQVQQEIAEMQSQTGSEMQPTQSTE